MESLYAELASNGLLGPTPPAHLADYLGAPGLMGATLERAGIVPDASMAQVGAGTGWDGVGEGAICMEVGKGSVIGLRCIPHTSTRQNRNPTQNPSAPPPGKAKPPTPPNPPQPQNPPLSGNSTSHSTPPSDPNPPNPPPQKVRQAVAEYAALPLGSAALHERLPHVKTLLLFGAERTGKSLLSHVGLALRGGCGWEEGEEPAQPPGLLGVVGRAGSEGAVWGGARGGNPNPPERSPSVSVNRGPVANTQPPLSPTSSKPRPPRSPPTRRSPP